MLCKSPSCVRIEVVLNWVGEMNLGKKLIKGNLWVLYVFYEKRIGFKKVLRNIIISTGSEKNSYNDHE